MKRFLLLLTLLSVLLASGKDLVLARKGETSPYSIVIPADPDEPVLPFLKTCASQVQAAFVNAVGVKLPVVTDDKLQEGSPAIFIGNTRQLKALGYDTSKLDKRWEHRILVKDGNVYLFGRDQYYDKRKGARKNDIYYAEVGSLKAAYKFLEDFASTRFIFNCLNNMSTLPMDAIAIGDGYSYEGVPQIEYIFGAGPITDYRIANNYFTPPWYGCYGGHSHDKAIPTKKYFDEHPDYFAFQRGKRQGSIDYPQYCFSNEAVRELIYQEVLNHLDQGYEMVQLSQSDGFSPCECENCRKLYGVEPKTRPEDGRAFRDDLAFGEKIWIMHRDMALRLKKDRPGKKVCVLAYGPTKNPPFTFSDFPDNMMIELCSYSDEFLQKWSKAKVPAGFAVYVYNWGFYNLCGLTPKSNLETLAKQVDSFLKYGIKGIYTCGFADVGGMDGAVIYTWLKRLENPSLKPEEVMETYCKYAYKDACEEMLQFHKIISDRCAITLNSLTADDWNDPALLSGAKKPTSNAIRLLAGRYPDSIVEQLDSLLKKAEARNMTSAPQTTILKVLRYEMDYLKVTTHAINAYQEYKMNTSDANFKELTDSLAARNDFLKTIPRRKEGGSGFVNGYPLFSYVKDAQLMENGRLSAPIKIPLCWNTSKYVELGINPGNRVLETDGKESMLWCRDHNHEISELWEKPLMLSATADDEALHVKVRFPNNTWEEVQKRHLHVKVGNKGEKAVYRLWGNVWKQTVTNVYVRTKLNTENQGRGDVYTPMPPEELKAMTPKPTIEVSGPEGGVPYVVYNIPWASLPTLKHAPGDKLSLNIYSETERPGQALKRLDYFWSPNINLQTWQNAHDELGTLIIKR